MSLGMRLKKKLTLAEVEDSAYKKMGFFNDYCPERVPGPDFHKVPESSHCTCHKLSSTNCSSPALGPAAGCVPASLPSAGRSHPLPPCTRSGHTPLPRPPVHPTSSTPSHVSPSAKPTSVQHPASRSGHLTGGEHLRVCRKNSDVTALIKSLKAISKLRIDQCAGPAPQPASPAPDATLGVLSSEAGPVTLRSTHCLAELLGRVTSFLKASVFSSVERGCGRGHKPTPGLLENYICKDREALRKSPSYT